MFFLAAAPAAAQPSPVYSTYVDGTAVIAAAPDGGIVAVSTVYRDASGIPDVQIVRFAAMTRAVSGRTFLGGSNSEWVSAVAVAGDGSIWISGTTASADFPLVNPLQATNGPGRPTAFLVHMTSDGSTILFSTLFATGTSGRSGGGKVVAIAGGDVVWAGTADASTVPTTPGVLQPAPQGGDDVFVAKITAQGILTAASYLGGSSTDISGGLAVGTDGAIYLAGFTGSTNLPVTPGAYQSASNRTCMLDRSWFKCYDGFVARLTASLRGIDYLTYLHGADAGNDTIKAVAVNASGEAFVTGNTESGNSFPTTPGAYQTSCRVCASDFIGRRTGDAFVTHLNATGTALLYSTFLSGGTIDYSRQRVPRSILPGQRGTDIAVDGVGRAFVTGDTTTLDFPVVNAFQPALRGVSDAFVARFNSTGSTLEWSTYLGGDDWGSYSAEHGGDIVLASAAGAAVYVSGQTGSTTFPTTAAAYETSLPAFPPAGFVTAFTRSDPLLTIDLPGAGSVNPSFAIGGWAIDRGATTDSGIDAIHVYAYPNPGSGASPVFLGAAGLGYGRSDIGSIFGSQYANAGWTLDVSGLGAGQYLLAVFARSALTGTFDVLQTRLVTVVVNSAPLLSIDVPSQNATSASPLFIGGWAIDLGAGGGTGIDAVHIWAFPNPGSGAAPVFLGVATYGIQRGDVGAIFGASFAASGYELRPAMAPGTYLIAVCGHSTVTSSFSVVQTRTVTIQ